MLNAEGPRGHQYADKFKYVACDIEAPFSPRRYIEAVAAAKELNPAVLIIDSASHMHDGPGGMLEYHDAELDRMAGEDFKKRERMTWAAWIKPKKDENEFVYSLLGLKCPVVLCFRAKEKIKIVTGKPPIDLGWQPIASDRISFETIFTLVLPPHCKGVPDLSISEMREPFDTMVPGEAQIDESLGRKLAEWAAGGQKSTPIATQPNGTYITQEQVSELENLLFDAGLSPSQLATIGKVESIAKLHPDRFESAKSWIAKNAKAVAK